MYKVASDKAQRKAERIAPRDVPAAEELLDADYRLKMLQEELRKVDAAIIATHPKSKERKLLGARKRILADEVYVLKGEKKKRPSQSPIFMEVARRSLPRTTFDNLVKEAEHVYDVRHGRKP